MVKFTDRNCIDSLKTLISFSFTEEGRQNLVNLTLQSTSPTEEFVREFRQYITKDNFTRAYKLTTQTIDAFPELFDQTLFEELYSEAGHITQDAEPDPDTGKIEGETLPFTNLSISAVSKYFSTKIDDLDYTDKIIQVIRESTTEELNTFAGEFISRNNEVDKVLLTRITDRELKDSLLMAVAVAGDTDLTGEAMKHLSNEVKENLIVSDRTSPRDFVVALSTSKDLGWQLKIINNVISGELILDKDTSTSFSKDLLHLIISLPEDAVVKLFKLYDFMPNAFSLKLCTFILSKKDFTEEQLIEMKDVFKKVGGYFILKRYAKDNGLSQLLENL